jgi:uncharacterized protein (TIGR02302 family)
MAQPTSDRSSDVLGGAARRSLSRKRFAARLSLSVERLTPLLWPPLGLFLLVASVSAAGGWSLLPGWLHAVLLASSGALIVWFLLVALRRFQPASSAEAEHRMETANPGHRPLTAVQDGMALGRADSAARDLWQAHRQRMAEQVSSLKIPRPDPEMPKRDPWAFRFAAVFLLALGLAFGSQNLEANLLAAMSPQFGSDREQKAALEAWITPPAYTARPPVFITAAALGDSEAVKVPANSQLLARYHGSGEATMVLNETIVPFSRMTERDLQLETMIEAAGRLEIQDRGEILGSWNIEIIPDEVPTVALTEEPTPTLRGALRIAYLATDDYGLTQVNMRVKRIGTEEEAVFELPLPGRRQTKITDVVFRDLTDHRWAGLPVELVLEVQDDAGQIGQSDPHLMAMPERRFNQPAARAVVEQRRKLIADADANRNWVVKAIRALQINPGVYNDDFAVHLMLSLAASELGDSGADEIIGQNEALLWQTALRIEDGQLAVALNKLRDVQERLMEALANGASEEEIQKLMDELQQAMDDYLDAMQQQAMDRMQNGEELQQGDQARQVEQRALSDMVDRARELSKSGARDAAREMLSQLQNMLENMQMGTQSESAQAEQQADQMMNELGRMMEQQQQLRDQTFERQQRQQQPNAQRPSQRDPFNSPRRNRFGRSPNTDTENPSRGGQPGETSDEDLADIQERIRRRLGELMRQLGENGMPIPDELGNAEQAMRDSEGALGEGNRQGALGSQSQALDELRRGTESILEDLANSNPNPGQNNEGASQAGLDGEQMDPLGRTPTESWGDTSGEVVPGEGALQRSREILDELRRRSGQRHRGPVERQYLDRLLQQF